MITYGLIGANVQNSFSKVIHEAYSKTDYDLFSLGTEKDVLNFLKQDFKGINVTIPYKNFVYENCYALSDIAKQTRCVNTVIKKNGKTYGYNTDVYGFEKLLDKFKIDVKNKKCVILGTGSTSRTVTYVLKKLGASSIIYLSRNPIIANAYSYNDFNHYKDSNIIINTTPVGMNEEESLIDFSIFTNAEAYIDVIYNVIHSKMAINALENNIKTVNGLYMLIAQAHKSQELFNDEAFEERIIDKAYLKLYFDHFNLALIGHPLAGKTYMAKTLSKLLDIPYIDIDEEIEKREGISINEIFSTKGEEYFRNKEKAIINENKDLKGHIISLGGGAVLNQQNIEAILKNSIVISLLRDIKTINDNEFVNRPLCTCKEELMNLIAHRSSLYRKYSDMEISNDGSIENLMKYLGEIL